MTTPTTANLLKYADLQMAAEAFIFDPKTNVFHPSGQGLIDALKEGNGHARKFTETQAKDFADHWVVLDQKANTPTSFSGTLFKYIGATDAAKGVTNGELVLSMRSTEFLDDAARDSQATNTLEVKEKGCAFGQIADMEKWYADIKTQYAGDFANAGNKFAVTGYSLGGHLATGLGNTVINGSPSTGIAASIIFAAEHRLSHLAQTFAMYLVAARAGCTVNKGRFGFKYLRPDNWRPPTAAAAIPTSEKQTTLLQEPAHARTYRL